MLNETLFLSSLDELKNVLLHGLTIFDVALVYVLIYVVYKALGRYIYFKPQEHSSKINRTFLTLSLLAVLLHASNELISYLPFLPKYRWLYAMCSLVIFIAPLSIFVHRIVWKYDRFGGTHRRDWHHYYLPIPADYYKTNIDKSETNGSITNSWEDEGVKSTRKNIHSDILLNILALMTFLIVGVKWAIESVVNYDFHPLVFFAVTALFIAGVFLDSAVFSWIKFARKYFFKKNGSSN